MAIPYEHKTHIKRFRRFIKDDEAINTLLEAEENTDQFLYDCLLDTMDEINFTGEPFTEYTLDSITTDNSGVPWIIIRMGATLQFLTGAGIHSARNTFTYSDGSGIQVSDTNVWGRYINYYNVLITKYKDILAGFKRRKNIENCYGGVHSEYNDIS